MALPACARFAISSPDGFEPPVPASEQDGKNFASKCTESMTEGLLHGFSPTDRRRSVYTFTPALLTGTKIRLFSLSAAMECVVWLGGGGIGLICPTTRVVTSLLLSVLTMGTLVA